MNNKTSLFILESIKPEADDTNEMGKYKTFKNGYKCYTELLGVFSNVENAEKTIHRLVKTNNETNKLWNNWINYFGFILDEHYLDDVVDENGNFSFFESRRTYLSDGTLNCFSDYDYRCEKKFNGRKKGSLHIKNGDIALKWCNSYIEPILVSRIAMTPEEWKNTMAEGVYGDLFDDSGVDFNGYNGHEHTYSPNIFPLSCLPGIEINPALITMMKKDEEGYFNGTSL